MRKYLVTSLLLFSFFSILNAQTSFISEGEIKSNYNTAFRKLNSMLNEKDSISFKQAVFITENTYLDNKLDSIKFNKQIKVLVNICKGIIAERQFLYNFPDSNRIKKYAAVFTTLKDTVKLLMPDGNIYNHLPMNYDFEDFAGNKDWDKMFVSKLLDEHTGNCHSLPFLYKIVADELDEIAYLSLAPNHIYIKHRSMKGGWYNTELTTGQFPIDAWLMASGYICLASIQNGIYMDALSLKQSIAVCMTDLAKGYERKITADNESFILQCCDTALKYFPNYINALLMKAETHKNLFEKIMQRTGAKHPSQVMNEPKAKELFDTMEKEYAEIHRLGYRKMPDKMYAEWLVSLKEEKEKYENKNITKFTNTKN